MHAAKAQIKQCPIAPTCRVAFKTSLPWANLQYYPNDKIQYYRYTEYPILKPHADHIEMRTKIEVFGTISKVVL